VGWRNQRFDLIGIVESVLERGHKPYACHRAVPGSQYLKLKGCGHFPFAERPAAVHGAIVAKAP
jgi:pimeloyl-ACP methyl ester carboxylesterase